MQVEKHPFQVATEKKIWLEFCHPRTVWLLQDISIFGIKLFPPISPFLNLSPTCISAANSSSASSTSNSSGLWPTSCASLSRGWTWWTSKMTPRWLTDWQNQKNHVSIMLSLHLHCLRLQHHRLRCCRKSSQASLHGHVVSKWQHRGNGCWAKVRSGWARKTEHHEVMMWNSKHVSCCMFFTSPEHNPPSSDSIFNNRSSKSPTHNLGSLCHAQLRTWLTEVELVATSQLLSFPFKIWNLLWPAAAKSTLNLPRIPGWLFLPKDPNRAKEKGKTLPQGWSMTWHRNRKSSQKVADVDQNCLDYWRRTLRFSACQKVQL